MLSNLEPSFNDLYNFINNENMSEDLKSKIIQPLKNNESVKDIFNNISFKEHCFPSENKCYIAGQYLVTMDSKITNEILSETVKIIESQKNNISNGCHNMEIISLNRSMKDYNNLLKIINLYYLYKSDRSKE